MRNFVLLRKGFIGNDLLPSGTTVPMPDNFRGSPYMEPAPPPAPPPAPTPPTSDEEIVALKARMAALEGELAQRNERDRKIVAAMEKLVT